MSSPSRRAAEVARDEYVRARLLQDEINDARTQLAEAQGELNTAIARQAASLGVVRDLVGDNVDIPHVLASRDANPEAAPTRSVDDVAPLQPPGAPLPEETINRLGWGYWREWLQKPHLKGNHV